MDKKKETLCNLGGKTLCDAISFESDKIPEEEVIRIPSLYTLAGNQFSSVINQVSENLTELDNAIKKNNNDPKFSAICVLGGSQLCNIINEMHDISQNLQEIEHALTIIGNGKVERGLKQLAFVSASVDKARNVYPSTQWKEAGLEGIEKAFLEKLKETEESFQSSDKEAMSTKANELMGMIIRMNNKEWQ